MNKDCKFKTPFWFSLYLLKLWYITVWINKCFTNNSLNTALAGPT